MARKDEFKRPLRLEEVYRRTVGDLVDKYLHIPTHAGLGEITARLVEYAHLDSLFMRRVEEAASNMVTGVAVANARGWRAAAARSSQGLRIYQALKTEMKGPVGRVVRRQVAQNAQLIQSVPQKVAVSATRYISKRQMEGARAATIADEIRAKMPKLSRAHVDLIARTEVGKAETAITEARSLSLGLGWYEWETSQDGNRVRKSHRNMQGVLVSWNDTPAPEALIGEKSTLGKYNAGECPNCRCVTLPLVRIDEVSWPHKVYFGGRIQVMTKLQFASIAGISLRRVA